MNKHILSSEISLLALPQLKGFSKLFAEEIKKKLNGHSSSLPCIFYPAQLPKIHKDSGLTVVIGGSKGTCAKWNVVNKKIHFTHKKDFDIPPTLSDAFIADIILGNLNQEYKIGVNFAYWLTPILRGKIIDGILGGDSKEVKFTSKLLKRKIGETLESYLLTKYNKNLKVAVANDIVCLLLASSTIANTSSRKSTPVIAGIVGTGVNFAFLIKRNKFDLKAYIKTLTDLSSEYIAVNLESGHFSKVPMTIWDRQIDRESDRPGYAVLEKQISGKYLYLIYNKIAKQKKWNLIRSTEELSEKAKDSKDKDSILARLLLERSAQIVAVEISGIFDVLGIESGRVKILMEGSLFWKGYQYKPLTGYWLKRFNPKITVDFVNMKDSGLVGGAMLALTIPK